MNLPMYQIFNKVLILGISYTIMKRECENNSWSYFLKGFNNNDYGWVKENILSVLSREPADFCKGCIYLLNKPGKYCKKYSSFVQTCMYYANY